MCVIIFKIELGVSAPPRHSEEHTEPTHMCNVRDVESLAWNDYLAFFVIPSLPRNPAKRKNIINAPTARFFDCAVASLRMT